MTPLILRRGVLRPPDATSLITRCHELRTKPLRDFTAEDLQIMIGQQVALRPLVQLALDRLRSVSLVEGLTTPQTCWPACFAWTLRSGNGRQT